MKSKSKIPSESQEQQRLVLKLRWNHPEIEFFSIPNGGKRNKGEARTLKLEGIEPGVPDLFFVGARQGFHGLFIEMKESTGGTTTKVQHDKHTRYRERGYKVEVCFGETEALKEVLSYFGKSC